jgi:hypothetical protein
MSKYAQLKALITERVFENASQAITGANLQQTLLEMVTSLGKGYQFGGLVSPNTTYTAGDEKIAFMASEAGRYPSFGNFSLLAGEFALFIWDGAWRKQIISYFKNTDVYGGRHTIGNPSPDLTRIGESSLHRDLPVQSLMRRCVVNNTGDVVYYLGANDSAKKEDGTSAVLNGNDGQVMVEVPEHYRKISLNAAQGYMDIEISLFPFDGAFLVPRYLVSAYEATLDRDNNILSSVVNTTARYRGGNNTADWDGTYRSLLGMPATNINLTNFRTYAQNRGTGWGCYDWNMHCDIFWLFAIEYATLNSQKTFNENLTAEGYHQGGLGAGVSNFSNWSTYNSYNPIIPCGFTNSLGNKTGVKTFTLTAEQAEAYGSEHSESVPSYRGIENPFGHIWKWADGLLCKGDGTKQDFYVSRVRGQYASTLNDSYVKVGSGAGANGYVKAIIGSVQSMAQEQRNYGDLLPSDVTGSASTYFCDYHYEAHTADTIYGAFVGGSAHYGTSVGIACVHSGAAPAFTGAHFGSRLCWAKSN